MTNAQQKIAYQIDEGVYPRTRFGVDERDAEYPPACYDCGVAPGALHEIGCSMEPCPRCERQFLTCKHKATAKALSLSELKRSADVGGTKTQDPAWDWILQQIDELNEDVNSFLILELGKCFLIQTAYVGTEKNYYLQVFEGSVGKDRESPPAGVSKDLVTEAFRRFYIGELSYRDVVDWRKPTIDRGCWLAAAAVAVLVVAAVAWFLYR